MRARAQIGEIALLVERDILALIGVFLAKLNLVRFALFLEELHCLIGSKRKLLDFDALLDDFLHLSFNLSEGVGCEGSIGVKIVVEAVVDCGTDSEFHIREQTFNSLRENMGSGVVERALPLFIGESEDIERAILLELGSHIADRAVDFRSAGGLCNSELSCRVESGNPRLELFDFAVLELYFNHKNSFPTSYTNACPTKFMPRLLLPKQIYIIILQLLSQNVK